MSEQDEKPSEWTEYRPPEMDVFCGASHLFLEIERSMVLFFTNGMPAQKHTDPPTN
jgi:hypothetical protein